MDKRILITSLFLFILFACTSTPTNQENSMPATTTDFPVLPTNTPIPSPVIPTVTPDPNIENVDLSAFASSWSTHDVSTIRTLYQDDAMYFSEEEMQKLSAEEPFSVLVSEDVFLDYVHQYDGYKMRILSKPIGIFEKLVAFAYRWEKDDQEGFNGVALLRYEDERIFMHVDVVSPQQTSAVSGDSSFFSTVNLDDLMKAWNDADLTAAPELYSAQAVILSDEDLAQAPWRDFIHPPRLEELFAHFTGWDPAVITEPLRMDDLAIFAWRWKIINYPAGYGVRLLHYDDSLIVTDVRFAIRPWEVNGKQFLVP